MAAQTPPKQTKPFSRIAVEPARQSCQAHWSPATRFAFRLAFVYLGLYVLMTQMLDSLLPFIDFPSWIGTTRYSRAVVFWVGNHIFHIGYPMVVIGSGSGDKTYDWVENFCLLALAILSAAVWSALDRKRPNYIALHKWFRLFLRFSLAATMIDYGMMKAILVQMPFPYLDLLLERLGNFSPMTVLWASIGASPAYEISVGCAELAGGIFLLFPRTTTFGTLVCLADALQVFLLNMSYDVPVKLLSFNLILFAAVLLAPDAGRLADVLFLNRATAPASAPSLFASARANGIALALQIVFGICLLGTNLRVFLHENRTAGPGRPKPALYGIWSVEDFSIDGQPRPPLLTDVARWRFVMFDLPESATLQQMDGTNRYYGAHIDMGARTLVLTKEDNENWKATFSFQQPAPGQLLFDGSMDSHQIRARLGLFDLSKFLLVSRGFHWVQEYPSLGHGL